RRTTTSALEPSPTLARVPSVSSQARSTERWSFPTGASSISAGSPRSDASTRATDGAGGVGRRSTACRCSSAKPLAMPFARRVVCSRGTPHRHGRMSRRRNALVATSFTYIQWGLAVLTGLFLTRFLVGSLGQALYGTWLATGALFAYASLADLGILGVMP